MDAATLLKHLNTKNWFQQFTPHKKQLVLEKLKDPLWQIQANAEKDRGEKDLEAFITAIVPGKLCSPKKEPTKT
jgi:hypothetical protein